MNKLESLIEELYEQRHQRELDTVLPVIGDEGMGKSTLIMQLAVKYCMVRDGEPPEIEELLDRICYDRADFKQAMAESEKQALIIVPDAARILYSMDVAKSEQKTIEKDLMDVRGLEYMILLGFQSWKRIGGEIKERRSKLALKIPRRGLVRCYGREAMDHRIDEGEWPSSTLTDKFRPLDGTDLWDEYQRLDEEKKRDRLAGEGNQDPEDAKKAVQRKIAIRATKPWAPGRVGMTQRDAAKLIDYSESWVSETVRDWKDGDYRDLVEPKEEVIA
jgi:hypothetical protein